MEEEIKNLREQLRKEQSLREEAERRQEEAHRRQEEAQRRQEAAEERLNGSVLTQYLDRSHSISILLQVITDPSSTTGGVTTKPEGRLFPNRIVPWDDFISKQEEVWQSLSTVPSFTSKAVFPSQSQLDYVQSVLNPVSSEEGLRIFAFNFLETAVQKLVQAACDDPQLRERLGLQGTISFESHTNLGDAASISSSMKKLSIGDGSEGPGRGPRPETQRVPKPKPAVRGKVGIADQFCIYRRHNAVDTAVLAIEYKPPHKLSWQEVRVGLQSEIQPERDVIGQHGTDFAFHSRALAAAVITQLFSYMVNKGLRYGYVYTGEALVFLYIRAHDPSVVYYTVSVPKEDVQDDDETRLHQTAIAQVFAFMLQAIRAEPPTMDWYDGIPKLGIWEVEVDQMVKDIPNKVREDGKKGREKDKSFKPPQWKGFMRSPIRTRSCKPQGTTAKPRDGGDDDDDDDEGTGGNQDPGTPTPTQRRQRGPNAASSSRRGGRGQQARQGTGQEKQQTEQSEGVQGKDAPKPHKPHIRDRPFCTHKCLLGLAYGGRLDKTCPNAQDHGKNHLDRREFLRLVRAQLASDRGANADAIAMGRTGAVGSTVKVRLSSHGYTLVAKGMERHNVDRLQHENKVYEHLRSLQGKKVPVCLGTLDLVLPYYHDGGVYTHFLFLSWAGWPVWVRAKDIGQSTLTRGVTTAYSAIHKMRVLHHDAALRNILHDAETGKIMVIDFERSEFFDREPLAPVGVRRLNGQGKLAASPEKGGQLANHFAQEVELALWKVSDCFK
ncbi:hypothetical protein TOPH_08191 [Tolypocladium ophioglossoides CBS 100239]|uniref:Protein kinase domain-containing protein n=1 Tax=Tolypocladium ophioglossoides (strain CBS 100239) TaxID=1163406 RepID=A0A0L0MZE7_TOLOC|nr:hypothetical protein TOPH_08191 [Tolypocladium ophioglossoides CBS 100239]